MTKKLLWVGLLVIVVVAGGAYWLQNDSEAPSTNQSMVETDYEQESSMTVMEPGTYQVDSDRSTVVWEAGKPAIAGYVHTGAFAMADEGEITLTDSELSGEVVIDINSLQVLSLGGGKAGQESALESHLKGSGFFNVTEYPTATFLITDVSPKILPEPEQSEYTVTGELTMKGVTNTVNFPMQVTVENDSSVRMVANFDIDRTAWGINSGSASVVDRVTDQIIGDTVKLTLDIYLTK